MIEPPVRLRVDREYTNLKDENASLVWIPELESFERQFHDALVDEKNI